MLQKDISGQAHAPVRVRELLAHRIADGLGVPPAALFRGQFRLCDAPLSPIEGWCSLALGARHLHACPDLRQYRILDLDGRLAGVVLGVALDPDAGPGGAPLASVTQLDCRVDAPDMADRVEALIARLVGRFIALCCVLGAARAYTDAAGDMGLLHEPGTGILGSSLPVILAREVEELPDFNHRAVLDGLGGYTLGYTRDRRVERLLPNHRLDLETMRATRFWPREDSLAAHEGIGIDAAAGAIIARLAQNVAGFQAIAPCLMPISGGQDSRILLGAAREHHARMAGFFGWHMHRQSRRDTATGARIAERLGLDYTIIARIEATIDEVAAFYARTGQLATGTALLSLGMVNALPEGHLVLRGNVLEIARGTEWGWRKVTRVDPHCARWGMRRLKLSHVAPEERRPGDLEARYLAWRDTIPDAARHVAHDLSFIENYYANASGARNPAHVNVTLVNAFADRRIIAMTLAVSARDRRMGLLNAALLARAVPDLADIPFV